MTIENISLLAQIPGVIVIAATFIYLIFNSDISAGSPLADSCPVAALLQDTFP